MLDVILGLIFVACCVALALLIFLSSKKVSKRLPIHVLKTIRKFALWGNYALAFVLMVTFLFLGVAILSCLGQWVRSLF